MNLPAHARGLLTELEGSIRLGRDNEADVRAELRRVLDDAKKAALAEQAALDPKDPERARYDQLIKDLDAFTAGDKSGKRNTAAAAAPDKTTA